MQIQDLVAESLGMERKTTSKPPLMTAISFRQRKNMPEKPYRIYVRKLQMNSKGLTTNTRRNAKNLMNHLRKSVKRTTYLTHATS
jgi:hypothetical protein